MSDFKAKMHKIQFPLGCAPCPTGGAYRAPRGPVAVLEGLLLRGGGRRRRGGEGGRKGKGKWRGSEGRGMEGRGGVTPKYFGLEPPLGGIQVGSTRPR